MSGRMRNVTPIIPARDTAATAAWYHDQLGFEVVHVEPEYGVLVRDDIGLHLWGPSGIDPSKSDTMIRIAVDDIFSVHDHCAERGIVHPNGPLTDQPWGVTEFAVLDVDGNLITFHAPVISIRPAGPDDAESLGRVHVGAWRTAYRGVMPDGFLDGLDEGSRAAAWRTELGQEQPTTTLVAEVEAEVLAVATYGPSRTAGPGEEAEGELWMINVDPAAWGRGIGRTLLGAATDGLRDSGYRDAILWVVDENPRARRLYEQSGWVDDGATQVESIGGSDVTELRYRLQLRG